MTDKKQALLELAEKITGHGECQQCHEHKNLMRLGLNDEMICAKCASKDPDLAVQKIVRAISDVREIAHPDSEPCDGCGEIHPSGEAVAEEMQAIMTEMMERESKQGFCSHCGRDKTLMPIGENDALVCKKCSAENGWIGKIGKRVAAEMQERHPEIKVAAILVDPEHPEDAIVEALNDTTLSEEERVRVIDDLRRDFIENKDLRDLAFQESLRRSIQNKGLFGTPKPRILN